MLKVRVLGLVGCRWCNSLIGELKRFNILYSFIDANESEELADELEYVLNTQEYPIVTISNDTETLYHLFKPTGAADLGLGTALDNSIKIGCATMENMLSNIQSILK